MLPCMVGEVRTHVPHVHQKSMSGVQKTQQVWAVHSAGHASDGLPEPQHGEPLGLEAWTTL